MMAKRILLTLLVTAVMAGSTSIVHTQSDERITVGEKAVERQATHSGGLLDIIERQKKAIAGSWLLTVTIPGFPSPPFKALFTMTEDGNVVGSGQGDVLATQVNTTVHGAWVHLGGRTFASTVFAIGYSPTTGGFEGLFKARGIHALAESGNGWNSTFKFQVFDPAGNVLFSGEGTTQAQRIKVELP